jgi:protein O-GlcNAc transferase
MPTLDSISSSSAVRFEDALSWQQQGDLARADDVCRRLLRVQPGHADAWHLRGLLAFQGGQFERSIEFIQRSLKANSRQPAAYANVGTALLQIGRAKEALAQFDRALALQPVNAATLYGRGTALMKLARFPEASADLTAALALMPGFAAAWVALGQTRLQLHEPDAALAAFDGALQWDANNGDAHFGRGNALFALERQEEALLCYDSALDQGLATVELFNNRGNALRELSRYGDALASFERALALAPDAPEAFNNRGNSLLDLLRVREALAAYEEALRLRPDFATALDNQGLAQLMVDRPAAAADSYERLLRVAPDFPMARGNLLYARMMCCDWKDFEADTAAVIREIGNSVAAQPFAFLAVSDSAALQLRCASSFARSKPWGRQSPSRQFARRGPRRLRVAYVSGDFREHAVAYLLAGVLEQHDREAVEAIGVALRPADDSAIGKRVRNAFDRYLDVSAMGDEEVARLLQAAQIDIAVDLMGYTRWSRPGVFAQRVASIQVNYLGYAGTMGAPCMDFILADPIVIPPGEEQWYSERVVRLPHCYLPNDDRREIGLRPTREAVGLPSTGFVFCAFTNAYKITPPIFDVWMRLLRDVSDSVLWLRDMGIDARANLEQEAATRGVGADRLVFASHVAAMPDHLGRHALADLYLDTLPYNAHSTVCDALWSGVPVLTCAGRGMAARVAASALTAMGVPELITRSLDDYGRVARELATQPVRLRALREKIQEARHSAALFATAQYTRDLERAFESMRECSEDGGAGL